MKASPRILITGGGGQLGRALRARFEPRAGERVRAPARVELDISERGAVRAAVRAHGPDWIINCAAYTSVDGAERDPEAAYRVNDEGVTILADASSERGARLIHLSTDYVFDGAKGSPYGEDDPTRPLNVYGASKLAGEERLRAHPVRSLILRTAWLYGEEGENFLLRMLEGGRRAVRTGEALPVVSDQVGSPTDVHTLSAQIEAAIDADLCGLCHAVAEGCASWYEFAEEIFAGVGLRPRLKAVRWAELGRPAVRPREVVLENRNLKALGQDKMIHWKEGLRRVLARLGKAVS